MSKKLAVIILALTFVFYACEQQEEVAKDPSQNDQYQIEDEYVSPTTEKIQEVVESDEDYSDNNTRLDETTSCGGPSECTAPYPIILAHGFSGFDNIGPIYYFNGVEKYLESHPINGVPIEVYTTQVQPYASIADRAAQLFEQIQQIGKRVNIIAHSMGGLDARYIASPNGMDKAAWIGSITTVSTPHHGTQLANFVLDVVPRKGEEAVAWLSQLLGLGDLQESVQDLSTDYLEDTFNPTITDSPDVAYYSISAYQKPFRGLNPILFATYEIIKMYGGGKNDGIVPEYSGRWANHLGVIKADHMDQIGHLTRFKYKEMYYNIVKYIRKNGF